MAETNYKLQYGNADYTLSESGARDLRNKLGENSRRNVSAPAVVTIQTVDDRSLTLTIGPGIAVALLQLPERQGMPIASYGRGL